ATELGHMFEWNASSPALLVRDESVPTTVSGIPLGPVHGAGGVVWVACAQRGSVLRKSASSAWEELPAFTVGDVGGGLFAIDADHIVLSSSGQSLVARYNGVAFIREDSNCGTATPKLFMPPGGSMWMGQTFSGLLSHE